MSEAIEPNVPDELEYIEIQRKKIKQLEALLVRWLADEETYELVNETEALLLGREAGDEAIE